MGNNQDLDDNSDNEQYQETIVNEKDDREWVHRVPPNNEGSDIYHKIGELKVRFDYFKDHGYCESIVGTGTVIFTINTSNSGPDDCYILTAAHNIRHNVTECAYCGWYREPKKKHKKCYNQQCGRDNSSSNQKQIIINATSIEFLYHEVKYTDFGKTLARYDCDEIYIDEYHYRKYSKPNHGFDRAILHFCDNEQLFREGIDDIIFTQDFKEAKKLCIFGYPKDCEGKMKGMMSNRIDQFYIKENADTNRKYIRQTTIDTQPGQSGSIIFYQLPLIETNPTTKKVCIIGLHVGGNPGKNKSQPFNIGTCVDDDIIEQIKHIRCNNKMEMTIYQYSKMLYNMLKQQYHSAKLEQKTLMNMCIDISLFVITTNESISKSEIEKCLSEHKSIENNDIKIPNLFVGVNSVKIKPDFDNEKVGKYGAEFKLKTNEFVEKYVEFEDETEILGLSPEADYMIRFRIKSESTDHWSKFSAVIEFKTFPSYIFDNEKPHGENITFVNENTIQKKKKNGTAFGWSIMPFGDIITADKFSTYKIWFTLNKVSGRKQFCVCYAESMKDITVWEVNAYGLTDTMSGLVAIKLINSNFYLYDKDNKRQQIKCMDDSPVKEFPRTGSKFLAQWNFVKGTFSICVKNNQEWVPKIQIKLQKKSIIAAFALWDSDKITIIDSQVTIDP